MRGFGFLHFATRILTLVLIALLWLGSAQVHAQAQIADHTVIGEYPIVVDANKLITEMFGPNAYGHIDDSVMGKVHVEGQVTDMVVSIIQFAKIIDTYEEVINLTVNLGCRPATAAELVIFDNTYPDVLRQIQQRNRNTVEINALGTIWQGWDGTQGSASVNLDINGFRGLNALYFDSSDPWDPIHHSFAVICENTQLIS